MDIINLSELVFFFFVLNPKVFADRESGWIETGRFNFSASIMGQKDDQLKQPMNRV